MLRSGGTLVVPDAYDAISALIIVQAGFKAVQCSGYSMSISKGLSDEKFLSLDGNAERTREIADAVDVPVMADGEDGYGQGALFEHNLKRFIDCNISGINIEDQNLWDDSRKEPIMPLEIMRDKIARVLRIKNDLGINDFILNARTDALRYSGERSASLKLAVDRANTYLQLGADLVFVTGVKTKDEVLLLKREIQGPLSVAAGLAYNIHEFSVQDCIDAGLARVSLPSLLVMSSLQAMRDVALCVKNDGDFSSLREKSMLMTNDALQSLLQQTGGY